jgi:hypothetical protein
VANQDFDAFDTFADDLLRELNARPLIIVGASRVEILLLEILDGFLLPKRAKKSDPDELLEGDRPLSTFSARIKLCFRLGILDQSIVDALEALRALRNPSAHHVTFDITQAPARDHLARLRSHVAGRGSFRFTHERYFESRDLSSIEELQCILLTLCALLEAIRKKISRTIGNGKTLRISKR